MIDKNSAITAEKHAVLLHFIKNGILRLKLIGMLAIVLFNIAVIWAVNYAVTVSTANSLLHSMYKSIYGFMSIVIVILGDIILLLFFGVPKKFLHINRMMLRVKLTNAAGETPILTERRNNSDRTETWVFISRGLSLGDWQDKVAALESALDVLIISIEEGIDNFHINLTIVLHPAPWPEKAIWLDSFLPADNSLLVLGINRIKQVTHDLSVVPHILIAGETGSGKTVLLQMLLYQGLSKEYEIYIVDQKGGLDWQDSVWQNNCHLITGKADVDALLDNLMQIMSEREKLFLEAGARNIDQYNASHPTLPRIFLAIDEVAALLNKNGLDDKSKKLVISIERKLSDITALSRAHGIHVILATQRPDATILSGFIRSNIGLKVCSRADSNLSLLVLDSNDAHERIPKNSRGRFITNDGREFLSYWVNFGDLK